jgi:hypothetical protein
LSSDIFIYTDTYAQMFVVFLSCSLPSSSFWKQKHSLLLSIRTQNLLLAALVGDSDGEQPNKNPVCQKSGELRAKSSIGCESGWPPSGGVGIGDRG